MGKNSVEIVGILDRSGSMQGLEEETISGYNEFIKEQRKIGPGRVTLAIFDDRYDVVYENMSLKKAPTLDDSVYYPRGYTALRDAIGKTIALVHGRHKNGERPKKTLVFIITDGHENYSNEYSQDQIKEMINKRKKDGWEFFFMGANIDSFDVGSNFNIPDTHTANYDPTKKGTRNLYAAAGAVATYSRSGEQLTSSMSLSDVMDTVEEEQG